MTLTVILAPEAAEDLQHIRAWYDQAGAGQVAARTVNRIVAGMTTLGVFPLIGRVGETPGTREHIVRRHRIIYRMYDDEIRVVAVLGPGQHSDEPC